MEHPLQIQPDDERHRRRLAGQRLLDAPDMDVPELPELTQELVELRGHRG